LQVREGKDGSRLRAAELMPRHAALFTRKADDGRAEAALLAYGGAAQLFD
jgi:crossover junction endodeoxyribonuclease RuvC